MGYQDVTLYKLKFSGREGLEVTAEGLSTGDLLEVSELAARIGPAAEGLGADAKATIDKIIGILAGALVEWNVEDRSGAPVPATAGGIRSLKFPLVMDIVNAWMSAQADVDAPLPGASSSGATTQLEASIPMSPSPGS